MNNKTTQIPVSAVLPHRPPMALLDETVAWDGTILLAAVTIRRTSLFHETEGVPAYVGIEYMAQACAAFAGAQALDAGDPVCIGFLLGARRCEFHRAWFRVGERLSVSARLVYRDGPMAVFDTQIEIAEAIALEAQLTVYQPPDINASFVAEPT